MNIIPGESKAGKSAVGDIIEYCMGGSSCNIAVGVVRDNVAWYGLLAISKSNRTIQSEDVQNFLHARERGISVELFVRKNKDDKISKEFYYLGHMTASGRTKEFIMPNTTSSAVEIEWILDTPVRNDLFEYIVSR